jgi:ABC-type transporter Mla MlaB component
MILRISEVVGSSGTTLRVDGRLSGEAVAELTRAGERAVQPLTLDLAGLQFADACGVAALEKFRACGAQLRNAQPYVALLLDLEGGSP